jgi:hypothetical protein
MSTSRWQMGQACSVVTPVVHIIDLFGHDIVAVIRMSYVEGRVER